MAWTKVQTGIFADSGSAASTTRSFTMSSAIGSGNAACGMVSWGAQGGTASGLLSTITDNQGNTYNKESVLFNANDDEYFCAFSRTNITGGPTIITANFSGNADYVGAVIDEFSGGSTASSDERDGSAHGGNYQATSTTATDATTSGTFTTTTNGDLIWGGCGHTFLGGKATGTGFTYGGGYSNNLRQETEYRVQTTAGAGTAATFTPSVTNDSCCTAMIALKPAGGSPYVMPGGQGTITLSSQTAGLVYTPAQPATAPLMTGRSRLLKRPWLRAMTTLPQPTAAPPYIPPNAIFVPGHALLTNMLACYLPGMYGGVPVSSTGPTLADGAGGAGTAVTTVEGPASQSSTLTAAKGLVATAPSAFKTWTNFTVYWRGLVIGAGDQFCPVVGVSIGDTDVAPYYMLGISANNASYAETLAFYGDSTTFETTPSFDARSLYGQVVDFAATATVGGNVTFYANGVAIGTNSLTTISTSSGTSKITVNQGIDATSRSPNASVNMACFWDRALSAGEISGLHTDPYAFLKTGVVATVMPATTGTLTLAGQTAALRADRRMAAGTGTVTMAGQVAALKRTTVMPATLGTLTLSGQTNVLRYGHRLVAGTGTLTLSGQVAATRVGRGIVAGLGTLTINGQSATLKYGAGHILSASQGTLTLSGQTVAVRYGRVMVGGQGTLTLSGQTAALRDARVPLTAGLGTLTLNGQTAALKRSYVMTAGNGTLTLSGQIATLKRNYAVAAGLGTLTASGVTVNLVYSGSGSKVLPAGLGTLTLAGQTSTLRYAHVMLAGTGTLALSGQVATLRYSHKLLAGQGTLTLSGQLVTTRYGHTTPAGLGTLTLSGQIATLRYARRPAAGLGTITMFGPTVNLVYSGAGSKVLPAGVGVLTPSGQTVTLRYSRKFPLVNGVLTLSGQDAILVKGVGVLQGVKVWTGSAWVEKPAKVWSGSAWVAKPVKTWSGSAWV